MTKQITFRNVKELKSLVWKNIRRFTLLRLKFKNHDPFYSIKEHDFQKGFLVIDDNNRFLFKEDNILFKNLEWCEEYDWDKVAYLEDHELLYSKEFGLFVCSYEEKECVAKLTYEEIKTLVRDIRKLLEFKFSYRPDLKNGFGMQNAYPGISIGCTTFTYNDCKAFCNMFREVKNI